MVTPRKKLKRKVFLEFKGDDPEESSLVEHMEEILNEHDTWWLTHVRDIGTHILYIIETDLDNMGDD